MESKKLPIILFCYPGSVFSRRVSWYLDLRRIPYSQCIQPNRLPRPDLHDRLGVHYRRIPILTIGRSIYCDTRLIIRKLDSLYPPSTAHPSLSSPSSSSSSPAADAGIAALLENWTVDGGLFRTAVGLIPADYGALTDEAFIKDREEMAGVRLTADAMRAGRSEALARFEAALKLLETTFFADGRAWVLAANEADGPSVADIHAVWPFDWLVSDHFMASSLSADERHVLSARYPAVFDWLHRFRAALARAGAWVAETTQPPRPIGGEAAAAAITGAAFAEGEVGVDSVCARMLGVEEGGLVEVWPTDSGSNHRDRGRLVGLSVDEVVLELETGVRVHCPRTNFRIARVE